MVSKFKTTLNSFLYPGHLLPSSIQARACCFCDTKGSPKVLVISHQSTFHKGSTCRSKSQYIRKSLIRFLHRNPRYFQLLFFIKSYQTHFNNWKMFEQLAGTQRTNEKQVSVSGTASVTVGQLLLSLRPSLFLKCPPHLNSSFPNSKCIPNPLLEFHVQLVAQNRSTKFSSLSINCPNIFLSLKKLAEAARLLQAYFK